MTVFDRLDNHEQVVFSTRPGGLRCIVAIHSTMLGPALGGVRLLSYSDESHALADALRLSQAMTYKAACAGLDVGGGKAVILGGQGVTKSETLLRSFGQVVESLGGRYIAACDMGINPTDLSFVRRESSWVRGLEAGEGGSGDSAGMTAYGVYLGMKACLQHIDGSSSVQGRHIAIDGVGKVGAQLVSRLSSEGARLTVSDIDDDALGRVQACYGAEVVNRGKLYLLDADIVSPNAVGGAIDLDLVSSMRCRIVAGGANNQLTEGKVSDKLAARGILYAPDFVINAGGLIQVVDELNPFGFSSERVRLHIERIPGRLREIFWCAEHDRSSTSTAAMTLAADRLERALHLRASWRLR